MTKFLRTIRFDETDARVFVRAADPGEWAVSGAFAFADVAPVDLAGKVKQAFANGFLGLASFGRSTFATVGERTDADTAAIEAALAQHLVDAYGAPSEDAARNAARSEIAFVSDLCRPLPINTVLTVRRTVTASGDTKEEFRTISPPTDEPAHAKVWTLEPDDGIDRKGGR